MSRSTRSTLILITVFIFFGYWLSDDFFFKKIIEKENISDPIDAFNYINRVTNDRDESLESQYESKNVLSPSQSPRFILTERKYIWCDEGAIVLATFAKKLGHKTRLVDLLDVNDGVSRHTVLEILENDNWILYDTQNDITSVSYDDSAGYESTPRYRKYPRLYNFFIQNNYFIKKLIFYIRGIEG